jgi:creatinine amidohydrolase/Fe(II)-dependent formamide hydrolase-like protein
VVGDPTKATREKGEIVVTRVVDYVSQLIGEIMEQYPVGQRPQTA